jgi:GNAT superfamily N-acetyltransferase
MNDIILDLSTSNLVCAIEANLHAHGPLYSHLPGAKFLDEPELTGLMTDLDPSESCVYRANFRSEQASEKIEQVLQRYRSERCLPMWWIVGPSTQPADLGKRLQSRRFRKFARPPGMAVNLQGLENQPALPGGFVIERVMNSTQLMQWAEIVAKADEISEALKLGFYKLFEGQGFGPEAPCQLFIGMFNGQPVATSRLFCAGGVAGIYHVATLPEARGRGFGTAMTLTTVRAGLELGYHIGILFATPAGYGVYRRLGFQEYCYVDVFMSPE